MVSIEGISDNGASVAATMDDAENKNARVHYLVDDSVGFDVIWRYS